MTPSTSSRRRSPFVLLSLVLALVPSLAGAAIPGPQTPAAAEFRPTACPWALPAQLDDGEDIDCGMVAVPLFHDEADGDLIELAVGVIHPRGADTDTNPVFMLNGGPGGDSGALLQAFAPNVFGSFADLRDDRTVVVFDQRGTGFSEPALYCAGDLDPETGEVIGDDTTIVTDPEEIAAQASRCATELEAETDLTAFTTSESARDIDDVRRALGYDRVDLWGQSYGTRLALEAMRRSPDGFDAVVLESVLPPDLPFLGTFIGALDDAINRISDRCTADPACAASFPDIPGTYLDAVDRFAERPYETAFENVLTGDMVDVTVDGEVVGNLIYQMIFSGVLIGIVPYAISSLAAGDTGVLDLYLPLLSQGGVATGFYFSVLCQDELPFERPVDLDEADVLPVIADPRAGFGTDAYFAACDGFDLPASDAVQSEPVESDIPTLLISGEFDPITPPSSAAHAAETLPNSQTVVMTGLAHTPVVFSQDCLLPAAMAFLDDPDDPVEAGCADNLEVEFLAP